MKVETMERKIFEAIKDCGGYAATWNIANAVGYRGDTHVVLKIMKGLEKEGRVKRHSGTYRNNIIWEIEK